MKPLSSNDSARPRQFRCHESLESIMTKAAATPCRERPTLSNGGCGMMNRVELRKGLTVDDDIIDAFAVRHGIIRLALFGSALRDDFGPDSDIDLLVEFAPDRVPGLLHLSQMELELERIVGRRVDLRTYEDLSHHFRDDVSAHARPLYAA